MNKGNVLADLLQLRIPVRKTYCNVETYNYRHYNHHHDQNLLESGCSSSGRPKGTSYDSICEGKVAPVLN
jgi:hypothetical protein